MSKPNSPAYPELLTVDGIVIQGRVGLTKRELFAAMAMQGMVAFENTTGGTFIQEQADAAVKYADALLKALEGGAG